MKPLSLASLVMLVACGSAPDTEHEPRDERVEARPAQGELKFLKDLVNELHEAEDGKVYLGLGDHARRFEIDPATSPGAKEMIAFAKSAKRSGEPVYATILLREGVAMRKDPRDRTGVYPLVVRLAANADPRERE